MSKNQVTLFVGDTDDSLGVATTSHSRDAYLITQDNYKDFLIAPTTAYTSLGDLPKDLEIVYNVLMSADTIVYVPPQSWSDNATVDPVSSVSSIQGLTEAVLLQVSSFRPVENLNLCYFEPTANPVVDSRKTQDQQLWFAGCSVTDGTGVDSQQRYGQLVADSLGIPCSFLTLEGSSIAWAADQILRADINENDTVVWGITSTERINFVHNGRVVNIGGLDSQRRKAALDLLFDENTFYTHVYAIEQVINYCKKHKVKLLLLGLLTGNSILRYLKSKSNYFHFPHKLKFSKGLDYIEYVDLGSDNQHPGIEQHKQYKDFVLTSLSKL